MDSPAKGEEGLLICHASIGISKLSTQMRMRLGQNATPPAWICGRRERRGTLYYWRTVKMTVRLGDGVPMIVSDSRGPSSSLRTVTLVMVPTGTIATVETIGMR